jgi:hypothetical protein
MASVAGLASHCADLAARAGVGQRDPATFALYGSAVRAAWTREAWQDVNVALDAEADPRAIVDGADFTVCQLAVHDGRLFHGPRFFGDLTRRVVVVNRVDPARPIVTLLRMYKYAARGYAVPANELHRVLEAVRRAPPADLDADAIRRHGGGVVVP